MNYLLEMPTSGDAVLRAWRRNCSGSAQWSHSDGTMLVSLIDSAISNRASDFDKLKTALESLAVWYPEGACFCHVHGEGQPMNRHLVPPHKHDAICQAAQAALAQCNASK